MKWALDFVAAFAISCSMVPAARVIGTRIGAVDQPNQDVRTHTRPTPLLGGLAIGAGAILPLLWTGPVRGVFGWAAGICLLCGMGLYKDISRRDLNPWLQLGVQFIACWIVLSASEPFAYAQAWKLILATAGVALINAVNFLDVMDGLCSLIATIIAVTLFLVTGQVLALTLAAACLGFWMWNRPRASIFMGDAGSFFIGLSLFSLLAGSLGRNEASVALLIAVPAAELIGTVIIRQHRGRALMKGDASHPSLCLLNLGVVPWNILALYAVATALTCIVGWLLRR